MTIKPIRNEDDLKRAFRRLEKVFQAGEGSAQADERDVLVTLVEAYENKHYDLQALHADTFLKSMLLAEAIENADTVEVL